MTAYEDKKFGAEFLDQIVEWISDNLEPEDVFSAEQLQEWARDNGYVAED